MCIVEKEEEEEEEEEEEGRSVQSTAPACTYLFFCTVTQYNVLSAYSGVQRIILLVI